MTQENVEIVRRSNALLNEGHTDRAIELLAPAVEWVVAREHPETRTVHGRDAVAAYQRDWQQTRGVPTGAAHLASIFRAP